MFGRHRILGFTIVELLVAVAILATVAALIIPRLRILSNERGIREAARIVGAELVDAAIRGKTDGAAGLALIRNKNYFRKSEDGNKVFYSSSTLYQLKQLRPFSGNEVGDVARVSKILGPFEYEIEIPAPLDPAFTLEAFSTIKLGMSETEHVIKTVATPGPPFSNKTLTIIVEPPLPPLEVGQIFPFVINRRPEISETTGVVLPRGYYINLNYSGSLPVPGDGDSSTWTSFTEDLNSDDKNLEPILILFGDNGSVDRVLTNGWTGKVSKPLTSIFFCIAPDEEQHTFELSAPTPLPKSYYNGLTSAGGPDLLNDPTLIWVTLNHLNGTVGLGENSTVTLIPNPAPTGPALSDGQEARINAARGIAAKRRILNQ